jgi:Tol biopolymer transport system component
MERTLRALAVVAVATTSVAACSGIGRDSHASPGASPEARSSRSTTSPSTQPTSGMDPSVAWIAYQADDLRMIAGLDGTGSRPALPDGPADARHPDWSPDGTRFAFVIDEADTRDIWIADWDGANARRVFDCQAPCVDADGPSWSPDGRTIAFRRLDLVDGTYPGSQLDVVDVTAGTVTTVATTETPDFIEAPRWSNDGREIVMNINTLTDPGGPSETQTSSDIAIVNLDDPTPSIQRITDLDTFPLWPDWHPTQDLILFEAGTPDVFDLAGPPTNFFTIRPDGSELTQLTHFGPDDPVVWLPAWTPDGRSILVTVTPRDETGHTIGVVNADGTGLRQLPGPVGGAHPRQRPVPTP